MNQLNETDATWEIIAPQLDTALEELPETDRDALLLRYFEHKTVREMAGILGTSEDAAQKRVNRAEEKLREHFTKKHLAVSTGTLVVLISANAVKAAPIGLSLTISATIIKTGTGLGISTKVLAAAKIGSILGSAASFLPLFGNLYFAHKAKLEDTKSPREFRLMYRFFLIQFVWAAVLCCLAGEFFIGSSFAVTREMLLFVAIIFCAFGLLYSYKRYDQKRRQIQIEEGTWEELTASNPRPNNPKKTMYMNLATACSVLNIIVTVCQKGSHRNRYLVIWCIILSALIIFYTVQAWRNRPR
jgi:hypothetical protein